MLLELRIEDYAVIDRVTVRLGPGLNVLTGETGAGKSIIVGALSLLLGERASSDVIRPGAERALVEGVFDVADRAEILRLLDEQGIPTEDGLLILRRIVAAEGRNRAWVNGAASTAALVGELGRRLVDLHGQHEHQTLLRADEQRTILDAFAGAGDVAVRVAGAHDALSAAEAELASLEERRRRTAERAEDLRFRLREIEDAALDDGEDVRIAEELRRLEHAEELALLAGQIHDALYAADASAVARLAGLRRDADRLIRIDPTQAELRELLETAYYALEEAGRRMGDYAADIEHNPARLEKLRLRQDLLYRLLRKYGPTIGDALASAGVARAELALLD
ncbi:MAG: AAA family ATPase, partial [Longimicrobiales bacterium]